MKDLIVKQIGSKGEIVIPKSIRKDIGLKPHQDVIIQPIADGILIFPKKKSIKDLVGIVKTKGKFTKEDELLAELLMSGYED